MMIYANKSRLVLKGSACEDVQKNVRLTLTRFQDGYTNRDLNLLDKFIEELFVNDNDSLIVGTADSEWCNGKEEIKNLTKATIRCVPLDRVEQAGSCILTGNSSVGRVLFAKAY